MHVRTKKLHQIMRDYNLTGKEVAEMLEREPLTIYIWRCKNSRVIPADALKLLEIKATAKAAA